MAKDVGGLPERMYIRFTLRFSPIPDAALRFNGDVQNSVSVAFMLNVVLPLMTRVSKYVMNDTPAGFVTHGDAR